MKARIRSRFTWLSVLAAISLGVALVVAATTGGAKSAYWFNTPLYDQYLEATVSSATGIADDFDWQQVLVLPLAPPDPAVPFIMPGGLLPLDTKDFTDDFLKGLIPVNRAGIVVYPITVYEDPITRERIILNAYNETIGAIAAPEDYDPLWYIKEAVPSLAALDSVTAAWRTAVYDPGRVVVTYDLILQDELIKQVWQMSLRSETPPPPPDGGGEGETNNPPYSPYGWEGGSVTNLKFVEISRPDTNLALRVILAYPADFTNRISVITGTDLVDPDWSFWFTTNASLTTNAIIFFDDNITTNNDHRFYNAYNADYDGDGDGVSDGAERFLIGSDPDDPDSDGDGMGDGAEIAHGFDPTVSNAFASLPYTENFESMDEGALHGQNDWVCAPTNSVVVQINEVSGGSQAAEFLASTVTPTADQFIAAQGETNVWIDFRAKIDPRAITYFEDHADIQTAPAYEPCVFAVNRRGEVWAYDGAEGAWTNDARFILTEYQWHRFTVREDYNDHTWDLFVDGIRVFAGIGFRKWIEPYASNTVNIAEFSRFTGAAARGGGWYVDDISVGTTQPSGLYGELQCDDIRVAADSDDADEKVADGTVETDGDLDFGYDASNTKMAGVRFTGVGISSSSLVYHASIQFTENSDNDKTQECPVKIEAQAHDNAPTFAETPNNISGRTVTGHEVPWSVPAWPGLYASDVEQRSAPISVLVQDVVDRPGWQINNSMVFVVKSTHSLGNRREADDFSNPPNNGPLLHVEWAERL